MSAVIRLDDLTLGYDRHPAVHHLTGTFAAGSVTAVVGPNGAGKSTLLKALAGLLAPLEGCIDYDGMDRRLVAYLPQQAEIDREFPIGVLDVVLLGHWRRIGPFRAVGRALRDQARAALAAVGLGGFEHRPIGALSAGQRQRVLFARVLVEDCPVILLDEPFTALDAPTTADLLALLGRWRDERRTVIAVLHDIDQVRHHFPDTLFLARERLGWGATEAVLTPEALAVAQTMSEAWDDRAPVCLGRPA